MGHMPQQPAPDTAMPLTVPLDSWWHHWHLRTRLPHQGGRHRPAPPAAIMPRQQRPHGLAGRASDPLPGRAGLAAVRPRLAARWPQDHQQSPHVPASQPGSDRGWLAPGPGGGCCRSAPAGWCGVVVPPGGRYAEGFCFCEEFSSNTRKSLHERKNLRNTGPASLTSLSGSGCRRRGW